ncbi:MAG: hydrogenase 2 small subunit [Acidobacteria bacterium]|nr:MAG: hydrogenase 2 small subunit [Acidobacteriota bacterium]
MSQARRRGAFDGSESGRLDRREFVKLCLMAAAAVGLPASAARKMVEAVDHGLKPSVIWLSFQECTGCTESLLRTSHPGLADLILDVISLDYHEALCAAAGEQAEAARRRAMEEHAGKYVCVIEGAIPTKDGGIYCQIGGRTALEIVEETARRAGAIIAIGSCASFGGVPSADPNPTEAKGAPQVLQDRRVVTIPGCPANPYTFLGVVLQFVTFGTLPALDERGRPLFAYRRTIHEDCPRRPHFDAGQFAETFGDEGHRKGYCLYKLGCKGPQTHAPCALKRFGEVGAWPIGVGHPCAGCTESHLAFRVPIHTMVKIEHPTPPSTFPPTTPEHGKVSPVATGIAGLVGGALLGAGFRWARKLDEEESSTEEVPS